MAGASGTTTIDFGAWPGTTDTSIVVTGQTSITTSALVECWIFPSGTTDHSADEHLVDPPRVYAGTIVSGTGFTIYGFGRGDQIENPRLASKAEGSAGDRSTRVYGKWTVAWVWDIGSSGTLPAVRELLSTDRTYYVRTDGSDSNNGLSDTAGGAFATFNKAIAVMATIDGNGFNITIQGNNATHTDTASFSTDLVGISAIILDCAGGTISVTNNDCVVTSGSAHPAITIQNVTLQTTSSGNCINHEVSGTLTIGSGVTFGAAATYHVLVAAPGAQIICGQNYSITGGASIHWFAQRLSYLNVSSNTITLTGTPNFTQQFAVASLDGVIEVPGITFSGSATGQRYYATKNGIINTVGGGATYLPGTVGGVTDTQGQYL